ncbi:hypothetical protein CEP54_010850 [Fusarium duplospermum]|uniref:Uncharacterized protein n=1 Tax=Fusarium duplospermum TaxID=1325734 RepID=A0A428PHN5_9HYPO|nr:hypothetical protein CEP54_010850 [Fusarium duplospermum]
MLDVPYRKWSPEDISRLHSALQQMFIMFGELVQHAIARAEAATRYQALTVVAQSIQKTNPSNDRYPTAYHQISRTLDHRARTRHPDTDALLTASFQALSKSASPLLNEWQNACDAIRHVLASTSTKESPSLRVVAQSLIEAHETFKNSAAHTILNHHAHLFDAGGNLLPNNEPDRAPPLFGVMTGLLYQEHILNLSRATITLIKEVTKTEDKAPKKHLWMPLGIRRVFLWAGSDSEPSSDIMDTLELTQIVSVRQLKTKWWKQKLEEEFITAETCADLLKNMRNPNSRQRHRFSSISPAPPDWPTNPEGLHALRTVIVTIALAIPAVIPSSAGFILS